MGGEKTTTQSSQNQTSTPTADPSMVEENAIDLASKKKFQPTADLLNQNAGNAVNALLTGQPLPGYLGALPGGISEDVTGSIVNQSLRDMNGQLARSGAGTFLESGASQAIGTRAASDIRNQSAQFNLQNLMQLLNIGVGGQAQVQQPMLAQNTALGGRLSGLTSWNQSGSSSGSTIGMNPFLKSFQTGAGSAFGGAVGGGSYGNFKAF